MTITCTQAHLRRPSAPTDSFQFQGVLSPSSTMGTNDDTLLNGLPFTTDTPTALPGPLDTFETDLEKLNTTGSLRNISEEDTRALRREVSAEWQYF